MNKPKIGKAYTFIRKRGNACDETTLTRYEDGSAGFVADGSVWIFECHPDAWKLALEKLAELGFMELKPEAG